MNRFLEQLRDGKLVERYNWSLLDDATLFQPGGHGRRTANTEVTAENAGNTLFLRVERQTLSQLTASGAVLFTIRVHVYPLSRIAAEPEIAARLAGAVRALPEQMRLYKSLLPFQDSLLDFLDTRAALVTA